MCPGDGSKICGGDYGAIAVYPDFPAISMAGLSVKGQNTQGLSVTGTSPEYNVLTGDIIYIEVTLGQYSCASSAPTCALNDNLPPVEFFVDFGDGSGMTHWTRENTQDLWRHAYSRAGTYTISITAIGVYDKVVQRTSTLVIVTETVKATDQVEIICPDVIHPGDYFNCIVDLPTGEDLTAEVIMTDDLDPGMITTTGVMNVPNLWMTYPGGNLKFASYNNSAKISDVAKGYVLPLTYFGNVANISAIEFLPVGTGSIIIEVRIIYFKNFDIVFSLNGICVSTQSRL